MDSRRNFLKATSKTFFSLPLTFGLSGFLGNNLINALFDSSDNDEKKYDTSLLLPKETKSIPKDVKLKHGGKTITFYNTHTGEWIKKCTFWENGSFNPNALSSINYLLRDHRSHQVCKIDPNLILQLHKMLELLGQNKTIHVLSGYRSKKTNELLRLRSGGVAKNSMHLKGRAVDIFVPGSNMSHVHRAALKIARGGVGKYQNFVHIDTGPRRRWGVAC